MIIFLLIFLSFFQAKGMVEEGLGKVQKIGNYSELTNNQKQYFDVVIDELTNSLNEGYFLRGLDKQQKSISDNNLVQYWAKVVKEQEMRQTNTFILSLFQTCYVKLGVLFLETAPKITEARQVITEDYIDQGFPEHVKLKDFYQILYNLEVTRPLVKSAVEMLQGKGIEVALQIVDCFLIDVLSKAPLILDSYPQEQSIEGITTTYKSFYESFVTTRILFLQSQDKISQDITTMMTFLAVKALCKKFMLSIAHNLQEEEQNSIKDKLQTLYEKTIQSPNIKDEEVKKLDSYLRRAQNAFGNEIFTQSIQEMFDAIEQKSTKQEQAEIIRGIFEADQNGQGEIPQQVVQKFPHKTIILASVVLLGLGGMLWYIRSHPRLFANYPFLQKLFPFLMPIAVSKNVEQSLWQKMTEKVLGKKQ